MINFNASRDDRRQIELIVERAKRIAHEAGRESFDQESLEMDLTACHLNGCPLDLQKLANADDFNFAHDVFGIERHMNRTTGQLENHFFPKCALPEVVAN